MDLENRLVMETIEFPVRYDRAQQTIWDSKNMMVCDIKGWGRIQFMDKSEERQDAIGEKIAQLLNGFGKDQDKDRAKGSRETELVAMGKENMCFELD